MTIRRLGVEEELLLADTVTGELRPVAREIIAESERRHDPGRGAEVKHEFFLSQLEVATQPHAEIAAIRDELAEARASIAQVGAAIDVAPLAIPGPVLPPLRHPPSTSRRMIVTGRSSCTTGT